MRDNWNTKYLVDIEMINDWSIIKVVSNVYLFETKQNTTKITKFIIQSRFEKIETIEKQVAQSLLIQWQSDHVFKKKSTKYDSDLTMRAKF